MSAPLSDEIIDSRISETSIIRLSSVGENSKNKNLDWGCKTCNYKWNAHYWKITRTKNCPNCLKQTFLNLNEVDDALDSKKIKRLSNISGNSRSKIEVKCLKCCNIWKVAIWSITRGKTGCPACSGKKRITDEDIDRKLLKQGRADKIQRIGNIVNINTPLKWKCLKCCNSWNAIPKTVIGKIRSGCPNCISYKGENRIESFLKNNNFIFERQVKFGGCRFKYRLPFDFAVYNLDGSVNCLIEYDGVQHFKPCNFSKSQIITQTEIKNLELQKLKDKIKTDFCVEQGYLLLRIPYTKIDQIEKILIENLSPFIFQ